MVAAARAHQLLNAMDMTRRLGAFIGIVVIVGLTVLLMWRVYLHHRAGGGGDDEPGVIAARVTPASAERELSAHRALEPGVSVVSFRHSTRTSLATGRCG